MFHPRFTETDVYILMIGIYYYCFLFPDDVYITERSAVTFITVNIQPTERMGYEYCSMMAYSCHGVFPISKHTLWHEYAMVFNVKK